jgi:pimeloyl-ACP methyl ester carboxylesterase
LTATTPSPRPFPVTGRSGAHLAAERYHGTGPGILLVHATGFCKELWEPVVEAALPGRDTVAVDQRGHGGSSPIEAPFDWWELGRDALDAVHAAGWRRPVGAGHSSGAAALVLAELLRPGTFAGLVLVEPIVFPGPPYFRAEDNPMSARALRRRAAFSSADAAFESFVGRGPFAGWDVRVLRRYVEHGFGPDGDGGITLRCPPSQEAEFYRGATEHGAWSRLGEIGCPAVVAGGAGSDSHPPTFLEEQASRFADAGVSVLPGATHFVPMEQPEAVGLLIRDALERWG